MPTKTILLQSSIGGSTVRVSLVDTECLDLPFILTRCARALNAPMEAREVCFPLALQ